MCPSTANEHFNPTYAHSRGHPELTIIKEIDVTEKLLRIRQIPMLAGLRALANSCPVDHSPVEIEVEEDLFQFRLFQHMFSRLAGRKFMVASLSIERISPLATMHGIP
jgi:hypothetical protein